MTNIHQNLQKKKKKKTNHALRIQNILNVDQNTAGGVYVVIPWAGIEQVIER